MEWPAHLLLVGGGGVSLEVPSSNPELDYTWILAPMAS